MAASTFLQKSYPILILHTSCTTSSESGIEKTRREDDDVVPNRQEQEQPSLERNKEDILDENEQHTMTSFDIGVDMIYRLPIVCDFLLMPEIPIDQHDIASRDVETGPLYINQHQKELNACGLSNVIVLKDLPWNTTASDVDLVFLLSLSSCTVRMDDDHVLPIDPIPSTFDFTIPSLRDDSSVAVATKELSVQFDVSTAKDEFVERISVVQPEKMVVGSNNVEGDQNGGTSTTSTPHANISIATGLQAKSSPSRQPYGTGIQHKSKHKDHLYHDRSSPRIKWNQIPPVYGNMPNFSFQPISQMNTCEARDHEARTDHQERYPEHGSMPNAKLQDEVVQLDRILSIICAVTIVLMILLAWSGYRLYRTEQDEKQRRDHVRRLLRQQTLGNPSFSEIALASLLHPSELHEIAKKYSVKVNDESELSPSRRIGGSNDSMESTEVTKVQPPRSPLPTNSTVSTTSGMPAQSVSHCKKLISAKVASRRGKQPEKKINPSQHGQDDDVTVSVRENTHAYTILPVTGHSLRKGNSRQDEVPALSSLYPELNDTISQDEIVQSQTRTGASRTLSANRVKPTSIEATESSKQDTLSPCSKLALQWTEKKNARRSNRKNKQGRALQPSIDTGKQDDASETNGGIIQMLPPTSAASRIKSENMTKIPIQPKVKRRLIEPPSLRCVTRGRDLETLLAQRRERETNWDANNDKKFQQQQQKFPPIDDNARAKSTSGVLVPSKSPTTSHVPSARMKSNSRSESSIESAPSSASCLSSPQPDDIPDLCPTPGSRETSFVDDYW